MKGFCRKVCQCLGFLTAVGIVSTGVSAAPTNLITNKVTGNSVLPPHARLVAGNASQNEFYILGNESAAPAPAVVAQHSLIKNAFAHNGKSSSQSLHSAVAMHHLKNSVNHAKPHHVAMKKDVIKIEMAFKQGAKKLHFAKKSLPRHVVATKAVHAKHVG